MDPLPSEVAYDKALDRAMGLLAARSRSRWEVRDRLLRAGFDPEVVEKVEARLIELSILDDDAFAREFVERAAAGRGVALRVIAELLRSRGVDPPVLQSALEEFGESEETESERALRLARRRLHAYSGLPRGTASRRLASYLAQRGYEEDIVAEVTRRILGEPGYPEPAEGDGEPPD